MRASSRAAALRWGTRLAPLLYVPIVLWVYRQALFSSPPQVIGGARVAGAFTWQLWWPMHALQSGEPLFWTRYLMWPAGTWYFFHTPINEALGLPLQLTMQPWAALDTLVVVQAVGAAAAAYALALRCTRDPLAAFAGGLLYAFSYYALVQRMLGHLGISSVAYLPLLVLAWLALERRPDGRRAAWLALAWAGATLADPYLAWFGAALPLLLIVLWRLVRRDTGSRPAALGALALAIGSLPALLAYLPLGIAFLQEPPAGAGPWQSPPLTALIDPPFWHPSPWIQWVRGFTSGTFGFGRDVGELQIYPGLSVVLLLGLGAVRRWLRGRGLWIFLGLSSLVLSLGPWLRLLGGAAEPLPVPLPYLPFAWLPLLSRFRSTNRAVVLATLAAAVLAAVVLARWRGELARSSRKAARWLGWAVPLVFIVIYGWEMALWRVGGFGTGPVAPSPHYQTLARAEEGALLELPVTYDDAGYQSLNAHVFLLHQSVHRRPMVLGFTARYPREALRPIEEEPFLTALTHPERLVRMLEAGPEGERAWRALAARGPAVARALGIRWYLLHTRDPILRRGFTDAQVAAVAALLETAFGPPAEDRRGNLLWEAYPSPSGSGSATPDDPEGRAARNRSIRNRARALPGSRASFASRSRRIGPASRCPAATSATW